jgi:hypothetical protein
MAAGCHAAVLVVLAFFPLLSSAFAPPASLSRLSLATSPLISSRIGRVGTPPLRESVSMKLSWEDKIGISVRLHVPPLQANPPFSMVGLLCGWG